MSDDHYYHGKYHQARGRIESLEKVLNGIHQSLVGQGHGYIKLVKSKEMYECGHVPPHGCGYFWAHGTVLRYTGTEGDYVIAMDLDGKEHHLFWDTRVHGIEVVIEVLTEDAIYKTTTKEG